MENNEKKSRAFTEEEVVNITLISESVCMM